MRGFRRAVARFFDFPEDLLLNEPRLTLYGEGRLVVENHRGLLSYFPERLLVARPEGRLEIRGEALRVARMDDEGLVITGRVISLLIFEKQ